ncbi:polyprenyl synthetase family protein [Priestia aryabhattai]|uniref:polyprenyl synthetase family protein n=1 Tax=Priestia aryabhattai TaxID=412384 RepID=UPI001CFE889F|nr:class 1 isoprenoid biosynthesis enzyme [Priestia aryabhattai]
MNISIYKRVVKTLDFYVKDEGFKQDIKNQLMKKEHEGFKFSELLLLHYKLFGGNSTDNIIKAMASIECLMLSLDIIDDIQDEDNSYTKENSLDTSNLLNISTMLTFVSHNLLFSINHPFKNEILNYYNSLTIKGIEGQHFDVNNKILNESQYIEMVKNKAGSFTVLASLIGAELATNSYPHHLIAEYSMYLGLASQLLNDANDVKRLGEKSDIFKKRMTLPILFILEHPNPKIRLIKSYFSDEITYSELYERKIEVINEILDSKSIEYTLIQRELYLKKGFKVAQSIPFLNLEQKPKLLQLLKGV